MVGMVTAGEEGIGGARRDSAVIPVRVERNQRSGFRWRSCWRKMPTHYLDRRMKELRVARVVDRVIAHGEGDNADTTVTEVTSRQSIERDGTPNQDTVVRAAAKTTRATATGWTAIG